MKRRLCGVHAVTEALAADARSIAMLLTVDDSAKSSHARLLDEARGRGVLVEARNAAQLDELAGGVRHQGLVAIASADYPYVDLETALGQAATPALLVALDEITDVHNLGAIVRSCVALGADAVITLRDRAAPVNAAVVRASAGATEHARIARVTNLSRTLVELDERGIVTVGLAADGEQSLADVDLTVPVALVTGSEGRGLRRLVREKCSIVASIPMIGPLGSLNASVATAIALYEARRQRSAVPAS